MNRFYVATMIAAVATILLASRVLMLRGSRSAIPRMLARVRFDLGWVLRGARNLVDDALHSLSDRELRDMGLDRCGIDHLGWYPEQDQRDRVASEVGATDEVRR